MSSARNYARPWGKYPNEFGPTCRASNPRHTVGPTSVGHARDCLELIPQSVRRAAFVAANLQPDRPDRPSSDAGHRDGEAPVGANSFAPSRSRQNAGLGNECPNEFGPTTESVRIFSRAASSAIARSQNAFGTDAKEHDHDDHAGQARHKGQHTDDIGFPELAIAERQATIASGVTQPVKQRE